jgi:para-aminobenzoate synthetase component 1
VSIRELVPAPEPLDELRAVAHLPHVAFLDGAAHPHGLGRWSYLAHSPGEVIEASAEEWPEVRERIRATSTEGGGRRVEDLPPFRGGWVGWFSYELGRAFDRHPVIAPGTQQVPDVSLARYDSLLAWDRVTGRCWEVTGSGPSLRAAAGGEAISRRMEPFVGGLPRRSAPRNDGQPTSSLSPDAYRAAVAQIITYIRAGDLFQANLTQQFIAPFAGDPLALYLALRRRAPGSHAAWLRHGDVRVLSMSPERFLSYDAATRRVETRPIKGTRPRDADPTRDAALAAELVASAKDRAENVMIVDLLRNDLSRVAEPGSVVVPVLCGLEHHAVHHLVSVVEATLEASRDALDLIEATFPGGSITGAPKLRATEVIAELEPVRRGVYCGAIGWLGDDGSLELSIPIRTAVLADGVVTVGAGGGITALSDPEAEYQESLDKAAGLLAAIEEAA